MKIPVFIKKVFLFCFFSLLYCYGFCQDWTDEQLDNAATASGVSVLSEDEQNAIMYINLARMYPKDFVRIELEDNPEISIKNHSYLQSLKDELNNINPLGALVFDSSLYEYAKCFAKESGTRGTVGHTRKKCPKMAYAECCSYGVRAGWDIALQWLVDDGITNYGHRRICLDKRFTRIGLSIRPHKKYEVCAVADFL